MPQNMAVGDLAFIIIYIYGIDTTNVHWLPDWKGLNYGLYNLLDC